MNAIEIRGLTKSYKDFTLENIDLTLPSGCIMGLIGENGAGKSTTVKLMLDMIHKDSGSITLLGQSTDTELKNIKEDLGVVLDEVGLPEFFKAKHVNKVMKNTYKKWDEEQFFGLLKKLKVPENKKFKELSRGMKMKMGIAIALSHDPKLLILDEATNGLDPVARDDVTDIFNNFTRDEGHSIIISSHIVSDLEKLCDYVAFIHDGRLLLCEEKDILLEQYGIVHCTEQQLSELDNSSIIGRKVTPYGAEAIIGRDEIPADFQISPINIEELFVFMVKESER